MTVYVGSLKYSPVFKSHCCAFGKSCEANGYSVRYLFSCEYNWMLSQEISKKTVFVGYSSSIFSMLKDSLSLKNKDRIKKTLQNNKPSYVYMHNYHFLNHYIAKLSKKLGYKIIYHMHEPFVENKKAHGGLHQYWLYLFEYLHGILLKNTDIVVVSSNEASRLFDLRYKKYSGKKMLIPLMYEDLGSSKLELKNREYITFVGPLVPAKNPGKFLELINYSNDNDLGLKFLLISRSKVVDERFIGRKNVDVFYKEKISDEEFGGLLRRSKTVITPYTRETQSSVVLVSYMYGTPVVSSNIGGLPEFVLHKKTGYLVDLDASVGEWIKGIHYVNENFDQLSEACRNFFVDNYSESNWEKYFSSLLT